MVTQPTEINVLDRPMAVRYYGARPKVGAVPLVVHFHGGAFVQGGLDSGSAIARLIAEAGAVVVSLDYPLAPAHPFPQAAEQGYAALQWAYKHRTKLAGDKAPVFVAGEEAGGNLAAAVTLMVRDQRQPPLAGQILLSPMLNPCLGTASLRAAEAGVKGCRWADGWKQYLSQVGDCTHPYAAPGPSLRLGELPPTLLLTAGDDPFKDESLDYARRLRAAGVKVKDAVLPAPTGWPCSCMNPASHEAPWAQSVREHVQQFFDSFNASASAPKGITS